MFTSRKDKLLEAIYLVFLFLYLTCSIIFYSPVGEIISEKSLINSKTQFTVLNWLVFCVLAVIYIFKQHESKGEIALEIAIAVLFSIVTCTTQNVSSIFLLNQWTFLYVTGMFIICATVTKFRRIAATTFGSSILIFAVFNYLSIKKIVPELTGFRFGTTIHYLGYYYYTHPSFYMLFAWLLYMYLRGEKKIGWIELCAELAVMYRIYCLTTCRLGFVASCVAFVLYIIFIKLELIKLNWKITKFASAAGFSLAAAFTLISGYLYTPGNAVFKKANSMLSGRLYLVNEAFKRYDINLFGRLIKPLEGEAYYYLDSSYVYDLFGCGIIFFAVVLFIHSYLLYHACKTNDKFMFVCLATLLVFTMVNDVWVNISYSPFILNFFIVLREKRTLCTSDISSATSPPDNT